MNPPEIYYFSYITVEENLRSIIENGILSHNAVRGLAHTSVADAEVQLRRSMITLPSGRPLHDYVNLYFYARNAMMYRIRENPSVCVLRVSREVKNLPGAIYSNRNAAVNGCQFSECGDEFCNLDLSKVYSGSWFVDGQRDDDKMETMQAELLIPDRIESTHVEAIYCRDRIQADRVQAIVPEVQTRLNAALFFV